MLLSEDVRAFPTSEERYQHCLSCGKELVVLPDDRRRGLCFDCYSPSGPVSSTCGFCGYWLEPDSRPLACPRCGSIPAAG